MEKEIADILSTLGHPQRLAVFRLLMRRFPDRVPAGEIAAALAVKPSTMSTYLAALTRAGLVHQEREGTSLLYSIHMANVQRMFSRLLGDCCGGRLELCMPFSTGVRPMTDRKYKVLFICAGNSARSIFAESILRKVAGDRFEGFSAGANPGTGINPFARQVLLDKGHDISGLRSKGVEEFAGPGALAMDFVFTVCDQSANEACPAWEGQPVSGHWGMPDPAKATGTDAERALAFQQAYGSLLRRIQAFTALPVESLDRIALQSAVDEIGRGHLKELSRGETA